jgi:hypothetical protein
MLSYLLLYISVLKIPFCFSYLICITLFKYQLRPHQSKMKIISSFLISFFYLQYYLTLSLAIAINVIKKVCGCLIKIKSKAKIHPYHNAHEGVFVWMGTIFLIFRGIYTNGWLLSLGT